MRTVRRDKKMLKRFANLFRRKPIPTAPLLDNDLGEFLFVRDIGWHKKVMLETRLVDLYLGSDGENPSSVMLETAKYWVANWESRRNELNQYMESELGTWPDEELRFDPHELKIHSIEILWTDRPTTCMIYFELNDDDFRQFHLTFDGLLPTGFAYDD
jgi:hypothetical protein